MPSEIPFARFVKIFEKHGISVEQCKGTSHFVMRQKREGHPTRQFTGAIKGGKHVKPVYVQRARKHFNLTPNDGVTDKEFFGR